MIPGPTFLAKRARERGVVLFIALIALVAMSLAGIALMRSVGAGILLAGNLDFKRTATTLADLGVEQGRKWFQEQVALINAPAPAAGAPAPIKPDLNKHIEAAGYYATWTKFDPARDAWDDTNSKLLPRAETPAFAQEVRYVIHRLCAEEIAPTPTGCVAARSLAGNSTAIGSSYGNLPLTAAGKVYYRVTARVLGTKGTVSFVQTVLF